MFLTTNRVGHFDDAFISRIHVVIRYKNLDRTDRKKIWENLFEKLTDEREDFSVIQRAKNYIYGNEEAKQPGVVDLVWNGREIRNGTFYI